MNSKTEKVEVNSAAQIPSLTNELEHDFMKGMAHDIRNPIHTMMIYTECLLSNLYGELSADQREAITELADATKMLNSLTSSLFAMEHWKSERLGVCRSDFDMIEMVHTVVMMLSNKANTRSVKIQLETPLERLMMRADREKMQIIGFNLLSPLVRFTDGSVVKMSLNYDNDVMSWEMWAPELELSVEERRSIADVNGLSEAGRFGGRALSMALAKACIVLQGGTFAMDEEHGLRFRLTFPMN
jgi:K+-sensing histidine kinase KdpD